MTITIKQRDDGWAVKWERHGPENSTGSSFPFSSYDAAVAHVASALTAASLDTGLLADTWTADMVFQQPTGDGRDFSQCNFTWRDPQVSTLPLMLQTETEMGHFGAELAGFISTIGGQNPVRGTGRFYDSEIGKQARDMLQGDRTFGVSVDPGAVEWACTQEDEFGFCNEMSFLSYEIIGLTMTPFPGFADAAIRLSDNQPVFASAPVRPPRAWFEMAEPTLGDERLVPQSTGGHAVPLTITDDGQVFGHVADAKRCHIGFANRCRTAPPSACGYAQYHLGSVVCDDGSTISTGPLTCGAMHASTARGVSVQAARDHYANSALAWADVRVVDGKFGPWACGALRPDVTDAQVRALQALSLSGDWREIDRHLELIACLSVSTPGFPIQREAIAASGMEVAEAEGARAFIDDDEMVALVAAGIVQRCPDCAERARLEAAQLTDTDALERRVAAMERQIALLTRQLAEPIAAGLRQDMTNGSAVRVRRFQLKRLA